jgi:hypothetical protein
MALQTITNQTQYWFTDASYGTWQVSKAREA